MKEYKQRKKNKLILGAGVNDAEYAVTLHKNVDGKDKIVWVCPYYFCWTNMLTRAYSESFQKKQPKYIGTTVCDEWLVFSNFRKWLEPVMFEGFNLDKDILFEGNMLYSPNTCATVSSQLNRFITARGDYRGEFPIGAHFDKGVGKFAGQCSNPFTGKREFLGYYATPNEAHQAWKVRKHELALIYANNETHKMGKLSHLTHFVDPRVGGALRVMYL